MIFQKQFIKDVSLTAIAIFIILLAILVSTQAVSLLGKAADGQVAIDAIATLIGFWILGMSPLLLVLTAYISILSVLTRYWRDSEMSIWLSSGLSLYDWIKPVLRFTIPLAVLLAVLQLAILPWAELRSREYAEILKQKQNLSLIEAGTFNELNKRNNGVYFIEEFDSENGVLRHLFLREIDKDGKDSVIFAQSGHFSLENNKRTLVLEHGTRHTGEAGKGNFEQVSFERLELVINTTPKLLNPIEHRRTIPTTTLLSSQQAPHLAELMWRISLPISLLLLGLLAIPLSYLNIRSGTSYHILLAIGFFLIYQNGLTLLRDLVSKGSLPFWLGLIPMHLLILISAFIFIRIRIMPARTVLQMIQNLWKGRTS